VHHLNVLIRQDVSSICACHDERPCLMPLWVQDNEMQLRGKNSTRTSSGCQMTDGWPREGEGPGKLEVVTTGSWLLALVSSEH
jgi:hypothetical protein